MLRIYDACEKKFEDNGICSLKVYHANVINKVNGDYYLELETSLEQGTYLCQGNIITAEMIDNSIEAFRIKNISIDDERIKIKAWHVFYDSKNYILENVEVANMNGALAMQWVTEHTETLNPFTVNSDIAAAYYNTYNNVTLCDAYMDLAENLSGYLVRHLFSIKLVQKIGADRQVTISLGKNLETYSSEENWDDVCTKLKPLGNDELELPETYVYSTIQYDTPYTRVISFDTTYEETAEEIALKEQTDAEKEARRDAEDKAREAERTAQREAREAEKERLEFMMTAWEKEDYEEKWNANEDAIKSREDAEDEEIKRQRDIEDGRLESYEYNKNIQKQIEILREKASKYLEENCIPKVSYTVKADNINCFLGDTIEVKHDVLGINLLTNVTELKYNAVTMKYDSITFGNYQTSTKSVIEKITDKTIQEKVAPATNMLRDSLNASKGALERYLYHSHVYSTENATYFLNAENPEQATKFLVMTLGGIGFGEKNYGDAITGNETFTSCWDIESNFTADYITGGILQGLLFKGGAAEFATEDGVIKILLNPEDGIRITHKNIETKEETPILYINTDGFITIVGDGTGLNITNNNTIKNMTTQLEMQAGSFATSISKIIGIKADGTHKSDGTCCPCDETLQAKLETRIEQTEKDIQLKATTEKLISLINISPEKIKIASDKIDISGCVSFSDLLETGKTIINGSNIKTGMLESIGINIGNGNFMVNKSNGFVTSNKGHFGGWAIGNNAIVSIKDVMDGTTVYGKTRRNGFQSYGNGSYAIAVGYTFDAGTWADGYFTVTQDGAVKCQSIKADSAVIGGSSFNGHTHATGSTVGGSLSSCSNGLGNYIRYSNGAEGATTGWCASTFQKSSSSDMRLKKDIRNVDATLIEMYYKLKPKAYRMKDTKEDNSVRYGLLAQQVISAMNECGINTAEQNIIEIVENAEGRDDGMYCGEGTHYRLNYENLHALHIAAIQNMQKKIKELEEKLDGIREGKLDI